MANEQKETDDFTTRTVMSLAMEAAELQQAIHRLCVVLAALALAHGVSTDT